MLRNAHGRVSTQLRPAVNTCKTLVQTAIFWSVFLVVIPAGISLLEWRIGLLDWRFAHGAARATGIALFVLAGGLGITSGIVMAVAGAGTPLPLDCPSRLVIAGPYRYIRNPMVVAGLAQGLGVGLFLGSWPVIGYALCGAPVWNLLVRPWEERDLVGRFGSDYEQYRAAVHCWVPRLSPYSPTNK
jgi:protein-S-isoprenylcysteine O-methyltransferase Ste14